jgi:hypothetical protein
VEGVGFNTYGLEAEPVFWASEDSEKIAKTKARDALMGEAVSMAVIWLNIGKNIPWVLLRIN